jgi:hypothetical protein
MSYNHKSVAKHNINFFLPVDKYDELRSLCVKLDIPRSELIRQGVSMILKKYREDELSLINN